MVSFVENHSPDLKGYFTIFPFLSEYDGNIKNGVETVYFL